MSDTSDEDSYNKIVAANNPGMKEASSPKMCE